MNHSTPTNPNPPNDRRAAKIDHEGLLRGALGGAAPPVPGAPPAPDPSDLAPDFPEFEILGLVGRGGMGAVYKAVQKKLQRTVALKILPKELTASLPKNVAEEFGDRYLREARALASLNHRHILTVHDFGERDGFFWLVTEFVDGVNLRQLMDLGQLSPHEALRITPQICSALEFAHTQGVVHRDIKPENILIDQDGQVRIADFGLAKLLDDPDPMSLTRTTAVFGTPRYMAPEQWRASGTVDHRADIYSLGVVLYEMLTGELPMGHFAPPSKQPGVPAGLDEVVRRTLAQHPENRYQNVRDVQSDVEQQVCSNPQAAKNPAKPSESPRSAAPTAAPSEPEQLAKAPLFALVLAAVVAAVFFGLVYVVQRGNRAEFRYKADLERYHQSVSAMANNSWIGPDPALPAPPTLRLAEVDSLVPALGIAGIAAVLLFILLGFQGIRSIRNARGRLVGLGLSVFVAWIGPLAGASAALIAPLSHPRPNTMQSLAISIVGLACIGFSLWFMVRETRSQRELLRRGMPQKIGGGLLMSGYVLAGLLLIGAGICAVVIRPAEKATGLAKGPFLAQDLLGWTKPQILGALGSPLGIDSSANSEAWQYAARSSGDEQSSLVFDGHATDDQVIASNDRKAIVYPSAGLAASPYLGQPIAEAIRTLGPPQNRTVGSVVTIFSWDNGLEISVAGGTIVGITPN